MPDPSVTHPILHGVLNVEFDVRRPDLTGVVNEIVEALTRSGLALHSRPFEESEIPRTLGGYQRPLHYDRIPAPDGVDITAVNIAFTTDDPTQEPLS